MTLRFNGSDILQQLEQSGFAVLPAVAPLAMVDKVVAGIERTVAEGNQRSGYGLRNLLETVPEVRELAESAAIRACVEAMLGPKAFVVRSILFDKTADANWKVAWHQDLTIAVRAKREVRGFSAWSVKEGITHVQPPIAVLERMLTLRLHLDDCDASNGPLRVLPGSHKLGRLAASQIEAERAGKEAVVCAVPRGGALLMRPLLLHASSPAAQPKHRRVVHLEFASDSLPGGLAWV